MEAWRGTFRAIWFANLVTNVGMLAFLPFFASHLTALGLRERDEIELWTGVLFGAAPLSAALMSPIWGVLGDRVGRRVMVLRSMLAIALFVGAMAFARTPWELLALRLLQGAFSGFLAPSLTLVSVMAPANEQGRVSAAMQQALLVGAILGPYFGDFVRQTWSIRAVYLAVSALALVSAATVFVFAREDPTKRRVAAESATWRAALKSTLGDLEALRREPTLRTAVVLTFWLQFGLGATTPFVELFVGDVSPGGDTGVLFSAFALANLAALPWWGRRGDRGGAYRGLLAGVAASAAVLALHAAAWGWGSLLVLRVLLGAVTAGAHTLAYSVAAVETANEQRGGAFGLLFAARCLAVALASVLGGYACRWVGIRGLFLGVGLMLVLALFWVIRGARARPTQPVAAREPA